MISTSAMMPIAIHTGAADHNNNDHVISFDGKMMVLSSFVKTLGGSIVYYSNAFATDKLFVVIILLALLGVGLTESVKLLEVRFAPWKQTERAN